MSDIDPVIFEFQAKVNGYLADLNKTTRAVDQNLGRQEARIRQLEGEFRRSSGAISGHLKTLTGALGAAFTAQGAKALIDDFTRLQNQLRVAGLEGKNLEDVQSRLLAIGTRYGASVNSLAELYSKTAQSQHDLGASQEQILGLTEETSQALLITGTSTQAASGAILGLGQALASGTVHAEEYNQMLEGGLQPLLAAAAASGRWGGSLGKLRQDITAGKVSSLELFRAMLEGAKLLEGQASKAVLTLSGSFTALNNQLTIYVGSAASSQGVTGALSAGILGLANNLDTVIPLLATIATYMGVRWVAGAVGASVATGALSTATFALEARMAGAATTAEALGFALNGLKLNIVAVGITALIAGIGYLVAQQQEAAQAAKELDGAIAQQTAKYADLHAKQAKAAAETNNLTSQQRAAITSTAALTGEVGLLANAWARVAAQAKAAALEQARAAAQQARQNYRDAKSAYDSKVGQIADTRKGFNQLGGLAGAFYTPDAKKIVDNAAPTAEKKRLQQAAQNYQDTANDYLTQVNTPLASFKADAPAAAPGKTKKKKKKEKKPSGPTAEEIALKFDEEMARLRAEEIRAQLDLTTDADTRAALSKDLLQEEYKQRVAQVEADKHFTDAQKKAQIAELQRIFGAPAKTDASGNTIVEGRPGLLAQSINRDTDRQRARVAENALQTEVEALQAEADAATTRSERAAIEKRILDIQHEIEKSRLEEAIASGDITDAAKARAELARKQGAENKTSADSNAGPLAQYVKGIKDTDINDRVESLVVDELNSVRDSIHNAISKTLGIKDPLISGLLNLLIEQVIMKPLAEALSKAQGGSGGGFLGSLAQGIGSLFGRASGGSVNAGQMYRVNEGASPGRVEGFIPHGSGQIVPLGKMNAMVGSGASTRVFHISVDARNSVTPAGFAQQLSSTILSQAAQMDAQASAYTLRAVPGRIDQFQRDGN